MFLGKCWASVGEWWANIEPAMAGSNFTSEAARYLGLFHFQMWVGAQARLNLIKMCEGRKYIIQMRGRGC